MEYEIRNIRDDELDESVQAVVEMFSPPEKPRDLAIWQPRIEHDPWKEKSCTRVLIMEGKIVSSVQIFHYPLRMAGGNTVASCAGVANVGTLREYRRRGLSGALLDDCISFMRQQGSAFSLLSTGIPRHYQRHGWTIFPMDHPKFLSDQTPRIAVPNLTIRKFEMNRDLEAVMGIYDEYNENLVGTVVRTPEYWQSSFHWVSVSWPKEDLDSFLVAEQGGEILAYLRRQKDTPEQAGPINEAGYKSGGEDALRALIAKVLETAQNKGFAEIETYLPLEIIPILDGFKVETMTRTHRMVQKVADPGREPSKTVDFDMPARFSTYWHTDAF